MHRQSPQLEWPFRCTIKNA